MKRLIGPVLIGLLVADVVTGQENGTSENGHVAKGGAVKRVAGQCHCGHIKFEARGPIIKCSYCDCRGCQRATGTLRAPFVTVHRTAFKVTAGKPSSFRAGSGEKCDAHGVWYFCPKCGSQVFWKGHKGRELDIFAGALDDTALFEPKK